MGYVLSKDGQFYRCWVNVLPNLFLWGASQFLAGRRRAGMAWFATMLFFNVSLLIVVILPQTPYSMSSTGYLPVFYFIGHLGCLIDGCRRRIPVRSLWFWSGVLILPWVAIVLVLLLLRAWVIQPFNLPTASMTPTILGDRETERGEFILGDRFFVNKLAYSFQEPQRGDLVAFRTDAIPGIEDPNKRPYLKRIVGLPGETIAIKPPDILVNGEKINSPGFFKKMSKASDGYSGYVNIPQSTYLRTPADTFTLSKDEYMVLGDNSAHSFDGRFWGPIRRESILGKAFYIYDPVRRKGFIE